MKTIQWAFAALVMAAVAFTSSGCLVHHQRGYSRAVVVEPAGAPVYRHETRYYRYPDGRGYHRYNSYQRYNYDRRDGYYDSRGYWHPYPRPYRSY
jgi:hypothetical protein